MKNSSAQFLLEVADGVLRDFESIYPQYRRGTRRDFSRLSSLVATRGLPVFTLDLPAVGKHFDRCLSVGQFTRCHLPLTRRAAGEDIIPRLFQGIYLLVFDHDGKLRADACVHAIATLRQLFLLGKKVEIECEPAKTFKVVSEFYAIERELPPPSQSWEGDEFDPDRCRNLHVDCYDPSRISVSLPFNRATNGLTPGFADLIQDTFDLVSSVLGVFDPYVWRTKHGPGAVSDPSSDRFKYRFENWPPELEPVFPYADFAFANFGLWADSLLNNSAASSHTGVSRLIAVPKTQKGPRLIAAEPTANQWCQQALLDFFATRVAKTWISEFITFRDQTGNQDLARQGSIDGDLITVDLSAASDRLTCRLVERAFRRNPSLLKALHACRTRFLSQSIDKKMPKLLRLKKFSTMGSACTFPVQSLIFFSIGLASALYADGEYPSLLTIANYIGRIRVFGDDIIVPKTAGVHLFDALAYLSFRVNADKTYTEGNFRESCGVEAYKGVDVTPSYVRCVEETSTPHSVSSTVEVSNNFFMRGWWHAAQAIQRRVQHVRDVRVVAVESGLFGLKSFCGSLVPSKLIRWCERLQLDFLPSRVLKSTQARAKVEHSGSLLQYYTEAPGPETFVSWSSGVVSRPRLRLQRGRVYLCELLRRYTA